MRNNGPCILYKTHGLDQRRWEMSSGYAGLDLGDALHSDAQRPSEGFKVFAVISNTAASITQVPVLPHA